MKGEAERCEPDSCKQRLTRHALDWWESARFQAVFAAGGWFRQSGVVASRPPTSNAHR